MAFKTTIEATEYAEALKHYVTDGVGIFQSAFLVGMGVDYKHNRFHYFVFGNYELTTGINDFGSKLTSQWETLGREIVFQCGIKYHVNK
jgi:hypothetical protein